MTTDAQTAPALAEASSGSVREVVGVFASTDAFSGVIEALQANGVDRARLSVLASGPAAEVQLRGAGFHRVQDLLDSPDAPRTAVIEPESVATAQGALVSGLLYVGAGVGAAAAAAAGAAAITPIVALMAGSGVLGGTVGGFLAHRLGSRRARDAEAHLAHGGLVLWVRTASDEDEQKVVDLMRHHGGRDIHAQGDRDRGGDE